MGYPELNALENEIATCFRCSLCKMVPLPVFKKKEYSSICPINTHYAFHSHSASGLGYMALALGEGRIKADKALADIVFSCRTCGYCDVACKFIMESERNEVNMTLRETLVREGLAPEGYKKIVMNMKETGNPAGVTCAGGAEWASGLNLKRVPRQKAKVLLYAGCFARNDTRGITSARNLAKILINSGADVGILGDDEICCGLPAHWTGFKEDFMHIAEKNMQLLRNSGARTIVTLCGACLGTFRAKYPKYGIEMDIEVLHSTEFLERLIKKKRLLLKRPLNLKATYHDPCYLGRQSEPYIRWEGVERTVFGQMKYYIPPKKIRYGTGGVFDPPRFILNSIKGLSFREMYRIREYSHCCGAGGGLELQYEEMSLRAATDRIGEARAVGAEYLITSCSHCSAQFERASEAMGSQKIEVMDIADLVIKAAAIEQ